MTYLTSYLPFPTPDHASSSPLPPPSTHLLITDTQTSSSQFTLYHLIASSTQQKKRVIWVDFRGEGRASMEAVMKKMGTSLPSASTFIHIMPSPLPANLASAGANTPSLFDDDDHPSLRNTYNVITAQLQEGTMVILDGLSELQYIGFSLREISRFVRATCTKVRKIGSSLVTTLHADQLSTSSLNSSEQDLLEAMLKITTIWWRVEGLASGRSGDVHGEISSHPMFVDGSTGWTNIPRIKPLQYRLEAGTVKVFAKGTGRGYL